MHEEPLKPAVARAFERFTTPPRSTPSARELAVLASARAIELAHPGDALDARSTHLAAYAWGAGPAVLLVHGWGGNAGQLAAFVAPLVERGFQAVAFDAPAHGASPGTRTSLYEFSAGIEALAAECGGVRALVGHSLGGAAVLRALAGGLRAERAVLLAPTASLRAEVDKFGLAAELPSEVTAGLVRCMEARYAPDVWARTTLATLAPSVEVPTLVVHDEHDPHVALAESAAVVRALPRGELLATRGLGHLALLRSPEAIGPAVDFVTR